LFQASYASALIRVSFKISGELRRKATLSRRPGLCYNATMRFDVLTLFPGMFAGPLNESILKRAIQAGTINVVLHDIRLCH
jgi:hypothetical protein